LERVLSAEHLGECLEILVEVLALASVALIWVPAFKMSRSLRMARDMGELARRTHSRNVARVAGELGDDARRAPTEFSATDHALLKSGFICAATSSALKLFVLIPAAHHWITL
jgi:hypothetical protein